jgi:nitrite reductase/ring-hydroxylating ferredoxin subunit
MSRIRYQLLALRSDDQVHPLQGYDPHEAFPAIQNHSLREE